LNGIQGLFRQPFAGLVKGFFSGKDFQPLNLFLSRIGFLDGCINDVPGCPPDIRAGTIAFDKRDDGKIGNGQAAIAVYRDVAERSHSYLFVIS